MPNLKGMGVITPWGMPSDPPQLQNSETNLLYFSPALGPLGRHPLRGRNWEGFDQDPHLAGIATAWMIEKFQSNGVQACAKQVLANGQGTQRTNSTFPDGTHLNAISFHVYDRALYELYMWPFYDAVKAGVTSKILYQYSLLASKYNRKSLLSCS